VKFCVAEVQWQREFVKTVSWHCLCEFFWISRTCGYILLNAYHCMLFRSRVRGVRLVSDYAHAFLLLSVVIVAVPVLFYALFCFMLRLRCTESIAWFFRWICRCVDLCRGADVARWEPSAKRRRGVAAASRWIPPAEQCRDDWCAGRCLLQLHASKCLCRVFCLTGTRRILFHLFAFP